MEEWKRWYSGSWLVFMVYIVAEYVWHKLNVSALEGARHEYFSVLHIKLITIQAMYV